MHNFLGLKTVFSADGGYAALDIQGHDHRDKRIALGRIAIRFWLGAECRSQFLTHLESTRIKNRFKGPNRCVGFLTFCACSAQYPHQCVAAPHREMPFVDDRFGLCRRRDRQFWFGSLLGFNICCGNRAKRCGGSLVWNRHQLECPTVRISESRQIQCRREGHKDTQPEDDPVGRESTLTLTSEAFAVTPDSRRRLFSGHYRNIAPTMTPDADSLEDSRELKPKPRKNGKNSILLSRIFCIRINAIFRFPNDNSENDLRSDWN